MSDLWTAAPVPGSGSWVLVMRAGAEKGTRAGLKAFVPVGVLVP